MPVCEIILRQIRSLGYGVHERKEHGFGIVWAEPGDGQMRQMVKYPAGDEEERYRAVAELAVKVGIDVEE